MGIPFDSSTPYLWLEALRTFQEQVDTSTLYTFDDKDPETVNIYVSEDANQHFEIKESQEENLGSLRKLSTKETFEIIKQCLGSYSFEQLIELKKFTYLKERINKLPDEKETLTKLIDECSVSKIESIKKERNKHKKLLIQSFNYAWVHHQKAN